MQSLEQKRRSALATLHDQRDRLVAEHDEAQDRANILYAQLRNNAELTQRWSEPLRLDTLGLRN